MSAGWINLSNILELNESQRYLFVVLPSIADTNGCFESDPKMICMLTKTKITDLEQLFKIMLQNELLESYKYIGKDYWYLTRFLETQRLRMKSKVPSPPWLEWQPEKGALNQGHTSQGRYVDKRYQSLFLEEPAPIDTKFTLEVKGCDVIGSEGKESANAPKNSKKIKDIDKSKTPYERMELALKEVLDGSNGIRESLEGKPVAEQQLIILCQLKGRPNLKIADIRPDFDIEPDGNDWKPYLRPKINPVKQSI